MLLFGLFALMSLLLVLTGTQVYRRIVDNSEIKNGSRVALYYIANKIRSSDTADGIRVIKYENCPDVGYALVIDGGGYWKTVIYKYDGHVYEALRGIGEYEEKMIYPELGTELIKIDDFTIAEENGVFIITTIAPDKSVSVMYVSKRT
jgi:hypothetical protein